MSSSSSSSSTSTSTSTSISPPILVKVSKDGGVTWKEFTETSAAAPTEGGGTTTTTKKAIALIMHAPWLSNDDFDTIAKGNLKANDKIRYRCTNYPDKYDQAKVEYIKNNYKAKIPGLEIGMDIAFSDKIVANAAEIKSQGFDFVEYNLETAFDGPNSDADAKDNVEKVRRAAEAVHAQGMTFKVAPGKPNSTSFFRTGLLDDVAKLVDQYHIQAQSIQDTTSAEYASFTEQITKALRAANPSIVVTSQISPSQGAQPGGTLQETMRSCIAAAMAKQPPGNTNGFGMWIGGDYVAEAKAFYSWFKQTTL